MHARGQKGFTLIEVMMVIAFVGIVAGLSIAYGIDSFRRTTFHSDQDLLIAALQRARAQSIGNICLGASCSDGMPHGVYVTDDAAGEVVSYTIFQGASFADASTDHSLDDVVKANPGTKHTGINEVVFERLSGRANTYGDIVLTNTIVRTSTTTVGSEGEIIWSN